jgi:hypothetical protein
MDRREGGVIIPLPFLGSSKKIDPVVSFALVPAFTAGGLVDLQPQAVYSPSVDEPGLGVQPIPDPAFVQNSWEAEGWDMYLTAEQIGEAQIVEITGRREGLTWQEGATIGGMAGGLLFFVLSLSTKSPQVFLAGIDAAGAAQIGGLLGSIVGAVSMQGGTWLSHWTYYNVPSLDPTLPPGHDPSGP